MLLLPYYSLALKLTCTKLFYFVPPSFSRCFVGTGTFFVPTAIPRKLDTQSTYIFIVPQCVSSRPNWVPSSPASECAPPPKKNPKGGGAHTRLRVRGLGSPNSDDWRKSLALLSTLWLYSTKFNSLFDRLPTISVICFLIVFL